MYDVARVRARVEAAPYREALNVAWRTRGVEGLFSHFVASSAYAEAVVQTEGKRLNTDDRTLIEFGFARTVGHAQLLQLEQIGAAARRRGQHLPAVAGGRIDTERLDVLRLWVKPDRTAKLQAAQLSATQRPWQAPIRLFSTRRYQEALASWPDPETQARTVDEIRLVAFGRAEAGDGRAQVDIERLRQLAPIDAGIAEALLLYRQGYTGLAVRALAAAFRQYRTVPWADEMIVTRATFLASQIAGAPDYQAASILFEATEEPFAVHVLEDGRRQLRLSLAKILGHDASLRVLLDLEPHPPWNRSMLRRRVEVYAATRHENLSRAERDLER